MVKNSNRIIVLNLLSTVLIQGLAFISSPIFSRILGTNGYGMYSLFNTWTMIVSAIFSLQVSGSLQVARTTYSEDEQQSIQTSILSLGSLSYFVGTLIVVVFLNQVARLVNLDRMLVIALVLNSYGQFCVSFLNTKYSIEFKAKNNFILSVTTSVLSVGLSLVLVYILPAEINYWGRVLGVTITYLVLGVVVWILLMPKGKTIYNSNYWKFALSYGGPLILHALSGLILSQIDRIMLQRMGNETMVGIYSLAYTFGTIVNVIWNAFNNSWVPFYFEHTRTGQLDVMKNRARNYLEIFTVIACGFVLLSTEVFHAYADTAYWGGTSLVIIFAIGYYMVFLYGFPVNYELYRQKNTYIAVSTVFAAVLNVILNYVFIRKMGYLGAAIATMIAHGLQFLVHYLSAKYLMGKNEFPFSMKMFFPYLGIFLMIALVAILTPQWAIARWIFGGLIGIWELFRIKKRKVLF